jgi:hypothetical protein
MNIRRWLETRLGIIPDCYVALQQPEPTNDPTCGVVHLREAIIHLVGEKITEIIGNTSIDETYMFFREGNTLRYGVMREHKGKPQEVTFFPIGWPSDVGNEFGSIQIEPDLLIIEGESYRISKVSVGPARILLNVRDNTNSVEQISEGDHGTCS